MAEDPKVKAEINFQLISKNIGRKKRDNNIITVAKNMCHWKMYTQNLLVDGHDEVAMYLPSTRKLISTKQQAN